MSYVSSAGIARGVPGYGKTCRQDVLRGVDVPVVPGAVPHDPDAAERTGQHGLLRLVGVGPAPVCRSHPHRIARLIEKLREPRRTADYPLSTAAQGTGFLPDLKAPDSSGRFGEN